MLILEWFISLSLTAQLVIGAVAAVVFVVGMFVLVTLQDER